ncbi:MAG: insulinase family protein [Fimbriimonadaceae bacterium]|nr:insulinase family protein [Fimbriimonadaceae bacterium]
MISALLAAAILQPAVNLPLVREFPMPGADRVTVAIVVPAPQNLSGRHLAAWYAIGDSLIDGTTEFSRNAIWEYGTQSGVPPRVRVFSDLIIVQVTAPPAGIDVAAHIASAMVRRPKLRDEDLAEAVVRRRQQSDAWSSWADPHVPDWDNLDAKYIEEVKGAAFQPERMVVCIAGAVPTGRGIAEIQKQFSQRNEIPKARVRLGENPKVKATIPGIAGTFEWTGTPITARDANFVHRIAALMALGVGKEGTMTRILRESLGYSYRQEVVVWPTARGWVPRMVAWRAGSSEPIEELTKATEAMAEDVEAWDESTLARAKVMTVSALAGNGLFQPFWGGPNEVLSASVEDRAVFWAYASLVGGEQLTPDFLAQVLKDLDLEKFKAEGKAVLDQASAGVRPAEETPDWPSNEAANSGSF